MTGGRRRRSHRPRRRRRGIGTALRSQRHPRSAARSLPLLASRTESLARRPSQRGLEPFPDPRCHRDCAAASGGQDEQPAAYTLFEDTTEWAESLSRRCGAPPMPDRSTRSASRWQGCATGPRRCCARLCLPDSLADSPAVSGSVGRVLPQAGRAMLGGWPPWAQWGVLTCGYPEAWPVCSMTGFPRAMRRPHPKVSDAVDGEHQAGHRIPPRLLVSGAPLAPPG